jgi:hypothetical protein
MSYTKYDFPVSRIGNTINPRFLILLENSASDPDYIEYSVEYRMRKENKFKPKNPDNDKDHMDFSIVKEYDIWWCKLFDICKEAFNEIEENDILALEFYPYFTSPLTKESEIYSVKKSIWNSYSKNALKENVRLLNNALEKNIPVFVYYKSGWYNDYKHITTESLLKGKDSIYISHYRAKEATPDSIRRRLKEFLGDPSIQSRISDLKRND